MTVSMTVVGRSDAELKHTATAMAACDRGGDVAKAATDTASTGTHVMTFPALLLSLVDQTDPVRVGDTEIYRVTVLNQGSGAGSEREAHLHLARSVLVRRRDGCRRGQGRRQHRDPRPHRTARPATSEPVWDLRVKADKPGDVRMKAELTSDYLSEGQPAVSIEPTRIVGSTVQNSGNEKNNDKQADQKPADTKE